MDLIKPYLIRLIIVACLIVFIVDIDTFAVDLNWSDRGNRYEGIITKKDVSGGYFKLLGIQLDEGCQLNQSSSQISVSFCLPSADIVDIKVWHPKSNYRMVPKKRAFAKGNNTFTWSTEPVIKPLNINIAELQVLVTNSAKTVHYPAQLFTENHASQKKNYRFVFESEGGVELNGTISREVNGTLLPVNQIDVKEDYRGIVHITWDGLDTSGKKVQEGIFHLHLEGMLYLTESPQDLVFDLKFAI